MRQKINYIGLLSILVSSAVMACDQIYFSPLAISHHWRAGDWNELHPGLTLECRKEKIGLAAGQIKNSVNKELKFISLALIQPLIFGLSARVGIVAGEYEFRNFGAKSFISPVASLLINDSGKIAFEIMHMPIGEAPATAIGIKFKLF